MWAQEHASYPAPRGLCWEPRTHTLRSSLKNASRPFGLGDPPSTLLKCDRCLARAFQLWHRQEATGGLTGTHLWQTQATEPVAWLLILTA